MRKLLIIFLLALSVPLWGQRAVTAIVGASGGGAAEPVITEEEYQAVYNAMTAKPPKAIAEAQNAMVKSLVDNGVWAELDVFYVFAQYSNDNSEALINWISPGTNNATLTNAPAFTSLEGFTGANTKFINTNYNPSAEGSQYTLNSATIGWYCMDAANPVATQVTMGVIDASGHSVQDNIASTGTHYPLINSATASTAFASSGAHEGLFILRRYGVINIQLFRNKASLGTDGTSSNTVPNADLYVLARNNNGTADRFLTKRISMAFAGADMSTTLRDYFVDAFETYMDSNGKGIIP